MEHLALPHGWGGGCCPWAWFAVGAGSSFVGTGSPCCGWAGCCSWAAVVIVGAGSLFADPGLWFVGNGACMQYTSFVGGRWLFVDRLFMGGLFVHWVVICGGGGAVSCVVCSWLANSDGTSGGRVLTVIHNLNNDERQHHRCLSSTWS